ncbi:hypothetical protein PVK06_005639 [Gossypium arboreum]|uniref:Uncharacterized protein n=1 Tax=Gossypium arboreum TaxID=29729 RepID=A0ABR0QVJ3_GOSAR|nr:hypothetical protein PVK06_005639 [Gossypium arboreum]
MMFHSLPTSWEPKEMAIEESKGLNSLSLDELIDCEKNEDSSNDDDEEMTMFAKRFKRSMRSNKEMDPIICYECKKPRHIKFDYPQWKNRGSSKQKLKAYVANWSDEDSSDNEDQNITNLYLMTIDDIKEKEHCPEVGCLNKNFWYLDSGC